MDMIYSYAKGLNGSVSVSVWLMLFLTALS